MGRPPSQEDVVLAQASDKPEQGKATGASRGPRLGHVWQVPALLGAGALFVGGVVAVVMTTPKPIAQPQFDKVKELIDRQEYEPAIEALNTKLLPFAERGSFSADQTREFHLYMARSLYLGQKAKQISIPENNENILAEYEAAEKANASLTPQDIYAVADTLVAMGRVNAGLERAMKLPESDRPRRVGLFRSVIEKTIDGNRSDRERALDLLGTLLSDVDLPIDDRVWATTRQARLLAESGYTEEAIAKLLRAMPRLSSADASAMGELYLMLGRCYLKLGDLPEAGKQFQRAEKQIEETLPQWGEAQLALARIDEIAQRTEEAKSRYTTVTKRFADTPSYLPAMLGLAESHATLNEMDLSVEAYSTVVDALLKGSKGGDAGEQSHGAEPSEGAHGAGEHGAEGATKDHAQPGHSESGHIKPEAAGAGGDHGVPKPEARPSSVFSDDITPERVKSSLMSRHQDAFTAGDTELALRFADLAERLYNEDQVPADVLLSLARSHRKLAAELLDTKGAASASKESGDAGHGESGGKDAAHAAAEPAKAGEHASGGEPASTGEHASSDEHAGPGEHGGGKGAIASAAADPSRQAQKHLIYAGRYFRRHANKAILTDTGAYADSLWAAADAFDRSGNQEDSIAAFQDYASAFPSDPRQAEAKFRLAEAFQARGDLEQAAKLYRELIDQRGEAARGAGAGLFADASYVPLAQTYLLDNDPANDSQAESLLNEVAGGRLGGTDTANFRKALFELGRFYYQTRNYERGIERLEELSERFPSDAGIVGARYRLADSYRLSASQIRDRLGEAMPDDERRTLETRRAERLNRAEKLFAQVRDSLESGDPHRRSDLESLQLRNSYFYLGDCAFDLQAYDRAIRHYDAARDRYAGDPASLVAMVQIVSAYLEQGDVKRAVAANERAKRFFDGLPEKVWEDPTLPMTRRDWERWLDATSRLAQVRSAKDDAVPQASAGGNP